MTTIYQEVVVRAFVTCNVWDCTQRLDAEAVVEGSVDDVYSGKVMIGTARSDSTKFLFDKARSLGWVIGAHDNLCPSHVNAAVYEYMKLMNKQREEIEALHSGEKA